MSGQVALFPELAKQPPVVQTEAFLRQYLLVQRPDREVADVYRATSERACKRCGQTTAPWIVSFVNWQHHSGMYCTHCLNLLGWLRRCGMTTSGRESAWGSSFPA